MEKQLFKRVMKYLRTIWHVRTIETIAQDVFIILERFVSVEVLTNIVGSRLTAGEAAWKAVAVAWKVAVACLLLPFRKKTCKLEFLVILPNDWLQV